MTCFSARLTHSSTSDFDTFLSANQLHVFGSYVSTGGETVSHGCNTFFEVAGAKKNVVKITFDGDRCRAN